MTYCKKCGKKLPENSKFCPKCGKSISPEVVRGPKTTGSGIASLILGVLGIVIGIVPMSLTPETLAGAGFIMLSFGALAIGLGGSVYKEDSCGKAGLILGIIAVVLGFLVVIAGIAAMK